MRQHACDRSALRLRRTAWRLDQRSARHRLNLHGQCPARSLKPRPTQIGEPVHAGLDGAAGRFSPGLTCRSMNWPRRGSRCSISSRASTTGAVAIRRSGISLRSTTSVTRPIPTHTSLPPCSRPSRTSPSGGPQVGPSLTAAARDGCTFVRAGTWRNRGVTTAGTGWPPRNAKGARPCPRASSMSASMYH
jgi:hypothetical protein